MVDLRQRSFQIGQRYIHKSTDYGTRRCVFAGEYIAILHGTGGGPVELAVWHSSRNNWCEWSIEVKFGTVTSLESVTDWRNERWSAHNVRATFENNRLIKLEMLS